MTNEYGFKFAFTPRLPGGLNMEIDCFLADSCWPETPFVRLYTWQDTAISLGRNQRVEKRVDLRRCCQDGIAVVRRPTGGRELLHGHDLCYSVLWPTRRPPGVAEARAIFKRIGQAVVWALRGFGIEARLHDISTRRHAVSGPCMAQVDSGEISVDRRKLVASAQRVYSKGVLQQGSMPLNPPDIDIVKYLAIESWKRETAREMLEKSSTSFHQQVSAAIPLESIVGAFRLAFEKAFGPAAGQAPASQGQEFVKRLISRIEARDSKNRQNRMIAEEVISKDSSFCKVDNPNKAFRSF